METQTLLDFLVKHQDYDDPVWKGLSISPEYIKEVLTRRVIFNHVYFHNIQHLWIPGILENLVTPLEQIENWSIQKIHCMELSNGTEFPDLLIQIETRCYVTEESEIPDQISLFQTDNNKEITYYKSNCSPSYNIFIISRS